MTLAIKQEASRLDDQLQIFTKTHAKRMHQLNVEAEAWRKRAQKLKEVRENPAGGKPNLMKRRGSLDSNLLTASLAPLRDFTRRRSKTMLTISDEPGLEKTKLVIFFLFPNDLDLIIVFT